MQRMGMIIGIKPNKIRQYKELHANVWPAVLQQLDASHIRNYTIFLREPENLLFGYWEYHGNDFDADMAQIARDPQTQEWWKFTDPCQNPLNTRAENEQWSMMTEVFHKD